MFKANYTKIDDRFKNATGGIANESRFVEPERERTRKKLTLPSANNEGLVILEQAWSKLSKQRDVVKMTVVGPKDEVLELIFSRQDLEQAVFAMAQGEETIKYFKNEARAQRYYAEPQK